MDNHEDFSSQHGLIEFYGSIEYPPPNDKWIKLGSLSPEDIEAKGLKSNYILTLSEQEQNSMVRYLKLVMHARLQVQLHAHAAHASHNARAHYGYALASA